MKKYWIHFPRGFDNEFTVYVTESENEEERLREMLSERVERARLTGCMDASWGRISRKHAIQRAIREIRAGLNENYLTIAGGFAWPYHDPYGLEGRTDSEIIDLAHLGTQEALSWWAEERDIP